ncbi:MAG: MBL fold metallo-hydrolase [Casimicrobiaceae bacterium]|nr:MBL fold metallo-hydrolase [Casimicrobiaceae bacterium]
MSSNLLIFPFPEPPSLGQALEVAPGLHWLRMPLPFALDHINLWLIDEGDGYALIDTGLGDEATRTLWCGHFANTLRGRSLKRIVVTHYHPDHLGNAQWLAETFATDAGPLTVEMSQVELMTAHAVAEGVGPFARATLAEFFRAHGLSAEQIERTANRGNTYSGGVPTRPPACRRLRPGGTLTLGGSGWALIGGYGHSPEHLALYSRERGLLISGDMLLPKISTNVNVWPVAPLADPVAEYLASLDAFKALPPETLVLPSHGLPFRGLHARIEALERHHAARMEELYAAVADGPKTAAELIPTLFRRPLDHHQLFFAIAEAVAHANHGWCLGRLNRTRDAEGRYRFALATA